MGLQHCANYANAKHWYLLMFLHEHVAIFSNMSALIKLAQYRVNAACLKHTAQQQRH